MSSAVTPDQIIQNYRSAYEGCFREPAPEVRKRESGGFSVLFDGGSKRYSKTHMRVVTAAMVALKDEVF